MRIGAEGFKVGLVTELVRLTRSYLGKRIGPFHVERHTVQAHPGRLHTEQVLHDDLIHQRDRFAITGAQILRLIVIIRVIDQIPHGTIAHDVILDAGTSESRLDLGR